MRKQGLPTKGSVTSEFPTGLQKQIQTALQVDYAARVALPFAPRPIKWFYKISYYDV